MSSLWLHKWRGHYSKTSMIISVKAGVTRQELFVSGIQHDDCQSDHDELVPPEQLREL